MEQKHKKFGILGLLVCAVLTITVIGLIVPWAFHIGGRFTPLYWSGTGMVVAKNGAYPLYVLFYPAQGGQTLHGWGSLCTSRNVVVPLHLRGGVRNAWLSLDQASMEISLSEPVNARENILGGISWGGLQFFGRWHGPELVLDNAGYMPTTFRSGFKFEHASVTLRAGSKSDFKAACSKD